MRLAAVEVIGVSRFQDATLVAHHDFNLPAQHDAAFLAIVLQQRFVGVGAGRITFVEDLQFAVTQIPPDLAQGNCPLGQFQQVAGLEKNRDLTR